MKTHVPRVDCKKSRGISRLGTVLMVLLMSVGSQMYGQTVVTTLADLRLAVQESDQSIVLQAGDYDMETGLPVGGRDIDCSGSNNTIDLTGAKITAPVHSVSDSYFVISGNNNVVIGGDIADVYRSGITEVTDFVAYNNDRTYLANGLGSPIMTISGEDNLVDGIKLTVRGSFPYGYGSMYGINQYNTFGMDKRSGLLINGPRNTLDNVEVQQRAMGHGIFMQGDADETLIKNSLVEGRVRAYAELYEETDPSSLPYRSDYKLPETSGTDFNMPFSSSVLPIPTDEFFSLSEDGIRAYNGSGSVTVENCTVKKMRGGIRLYLGSTSVVTNSTAIDCGNTNYNMSNGGTIVNSSGNFAYAPLSDFRLSRSNMNLEWTIIPSPHATGPHNVCDVLGNNHTIVFHRTEGPLEETTRAIVVTGNNSVITNETEYPVILAESASGNTIVSFGPVTDNGSNNSVERDSDGDGMLDSVDTDDDNDGYLDGDDAFPTDANEWADADSDNVGDNSDAFPQNALEWLDTDEDGTGNNEDTDDDGDGVADADDLFPLDVLEWLDADQDGTGDNADTDDDNDGVADADDLYPFDPSEWADTDEDGIPDNSEVSGNFVNISTRAYVSDGDKVTIAGFVIEGTDSETLLIQTVGAELGESPFGLEDVILDTVLEVYNSENEMILENDNWDAAGAASIVAASDAVGAFVLEPGSGSSAVLATLEPGIYTVILSSKDQTAGIGLIEVYQATSSNPVPELR